MQVAKKIPLGADVDLKAVARDARLEGTLSHTHTHTLYLSLCLSLSRCLSLSLSKPYTP